VPVSKITNKFFLLIIKLVPKLLQTLHDSKNEGEVTVARKIIVFEFQAAFDRKENKDNEAAYKLCDLLTTGTAQKIGY
jgi:hypothetical protein